MDDEVAKTEKEQQGMIEGVWLSRPADDGPGVLVWDGLVVQEGLVARNDGQIVHPEVAQARPPTIREALLADLKGRKVVLPNPLDLFPDWEVEVNPEHEKIKEDVERLSKSFLASDFLNVKVREADPALLVSMFWPRASYARLKTLLHLVVWQGIFDDTVDLHNKDHPHMTLELRENMKRYIDAALAADTPRSVPSTPVSIGSTVVRNIAAVFGAVRPEYDEDQRGYLREYLHLYIDSTAQEESMVKSDDLPQWQRYQSIRADFGGVLPLLGMSEYAVGGRLPKGFFMTSEFLALCHAVGITVSLSNDLVSLKKEIKAGSVVSAIPIVYGGNLPPLAKATATAPTGGDIDEAVSIVVSQIKEAVVRLQENLDSVSARFDSAGEAMLVQEVLRNVKSIVIGNVAWALQCKRYGMAEHRNEDGGYEFILE